MKQMREAIMIILQRESEQQYKQLAIARQDFKRRAAN